MNKTYQTHIPDQPGMTDSAHKLSRLKIPDDLKGKRVLDIGCNEGYFCNVALMRDASSVTGVDADARALDAAADRYSDERLNFVNSDWHSLPEGQYDVILWTSAMHYELDPLKVLRNVHSRLAPGGFFILECGLLDIPRKEMVYSIRNDGGHWYPTAPLLDDMLERAGFKHRIVSHAEHIGVDPVPRTVFHCTRARPDVLIVRGRSGSGKTNLAKSIEHSATKVISLDYFVSRIAGSKFTPRGDLENFIKTNIDRKNLKKLYEGIDENGYCDAYTALISKSIADTDILVVIEGFITDQQLDSLKNKIKTMANVWVVEP